MYESIMNSLLKKGGVPKVIFMTFETPSYFIIHETFSTITRTNKHPVKIGITTKKYPR